MTPIWSLSLVIGAVAAIVSIILWRYGAATYPWPLVWLGSLVIAVACSWISDLSLMVQMPYTIYAITLHIIWTLFNIAMSVVTFALWAGFGE